jgi:hypothetical protein
MRGRDLINIRGIVEDIVNARPLEKEGEGDIQDPVPLEGDDIYTKQFDKSTNQHHQKPGVQNI